MPYKLFISFILIMVSAAANATVPMYRTSVGGYGSSPEAACQAKVVSGYTYSAAASGSCWGSIPGQGSYSYANYALVQMPDCPAGQVYNSAGTCGAPPPRQPTCNTPAGGSESWTQKTGHSASPTAESGDGAPGPYPTTSPNCGLSGKPGVENCYSRPASDGGQDFFCKFSGKSTGTNAPAGTAAGVDGGQPADSKPASAPPTSPDSQGKCPAGTVQGGVDSTGIPICIGNGTNPSGSAGKGSAADTRPTSSVTKTTKDASGNTVETTIGTRSNSDGSTTTTTTTTTTAADGSKSTSSSSQTGNNSGGMQGKPDAPETDMCKLHPELNVCKNSSVTGSCGAIACQGDAIQCATLRAAAAMQCAQEQDLAAVKALPSKGLGDAIAGGVDPLKGQIDGTIKGSEVDLSRPTLDQNGFLGGGSCIPDKTFTVMGKSVVVSFARVCNDIQPLRFIVMSCAFILAYMIVSKSVINA